MRNLKKIKRQITKGLTIVSPLLLAVAFGFFIGHSIYGKEVVTSNTNRRIDHALSTNRSTGLTSNQANPSQSLEETLKQLAKDLDGSEVKIEKQGASGSSELYKYEAFRVDGCSVQWHETHETFEGGRKISTVTQDTTVLLSTLDPSSVREDKIWNSKFLLSFTSSGLRQTIKGHQHIIEEGGRDEEGDSLQSGYGFYLGNEQRARRLAKSLTFAIRECKRRGA